MEVILQPIDLGNFPTLIGEHKKLLAVSFYGIPVCYNASSPFYFSIRTLHFTLRKSKSKPVIDNFFECNDYKEVFTRFNITRENSTKKIGVEEMFSTKLLWLAIRWQDSYMFCRGMAKAFIGVDIDSETIEPTQDQKYKNNVWYVKLFGIRTTRDETDGLVNLPEAIRSLEDIYDLEHKQMQKFARDNPTLNKMYSRFFEARDANRDDYIKMKAIFRSPATYLHPNLLLMNLDNFTKPMLFWETFINYYKKQEQKTENPLLSIDLNDTWIKDINEDLAIAKLDDLDLKYHKRTSYIHARTLVKLVSPGNEKNFQRWFNSSRATAYIPKLEAKLRPIIETLLKTSKVITEEPEILLESEGDALTKETSEIVIESEDEGSAETVNVDAIIDEQLAEHPSWFMIPVQEGVDGAFTGYFLHPILSVALIMHFAPERIISNLQTIAVNYQRAALEGTTAAELTRKEFEKLKKELEETKAENTKLAAENTKLKREIEIQYLIETGSIVISKVPSGIHLSSSVLNEPERDDKLVFNDIHKPKHILDKAEKGLKSRFQQVRKNVYISDFTDEDKAFITQIINEAIASVPSTEFVFNEEEYNKRLERFNMNPLESLRGFLYESECSQHFSARLYGDVPDEWLEQFGLNRKDPGIDLVDIRRKIVYQCKWYKLLKMTTAIQRTRNAIQRLKTIDNEYQIKLIVPDNCYVHKAVREIFDAVETFGHK